MLSRSIIFRGVVLPAALGVLLVGQAMASPSTALASGFIHHTVAVVIPTSPFPPLPPNPPGVAVVIPTSPFPPLPPNPPGVAVVIPTSPFPPLPPNPPGIARS